MDYWCEKRCALSLDLKESRVGDCGRERETLFRVDGPKMEKEPEPKVESLDRGIWRVKVCEAERGERDGV